MGPESEGIMPHKLTVEDLETLNDLVQDGLIEGLRQKSDHAVTWWR